MTMCIRNETNGQTNSDVRNSQFSPLQFEGDSPPSSPIQISNSCTSSKSETFSFLPTITFGEFEGSSL